MALFEIDHEAQPDLVGHAHAVGPDGMLGGDEIGIGDDQPGLQPRAVECGVADGADTAPLACLPEAVPDTEGEPCLYEKLVAQIASKTGARNGDAAVLM